MKYNVIHKVKETRRYTFSEYVWFHIIGTNYVFYVIKAKTLYSYLECVCKLWHITYMLTVHTCNETVAHHHWRCCAGNHTGQCSEPAICKAPVYPNYTDKNECILCLPVLPNVHCQGMRNREACWENLPITKRSQVWLQQQTHVLVGFNWGSSLGMIMYWEDVIQPCHWMIISGYDHQSSYLRGPLFTLFGWCT